MSDELHARVKEIFLLAAEKTEAERPAFLDEACEDDPELLREVESLLLHHEGDDEPGPSPEPTISRAPTQYQPRRGGRTPSSGTLTTRTTGRFQPGDVFARRYRILALLGMGGMGEVYQAEDQVLNVPVALKFITGSGPEHTERLLREVRLAREVTHANVCRVYDVDQVGEEYFFTMEHVDGEDLSALLRRIGRFPSDKLLDLARQLCAGLAAAHAKGVLHHDLKPANILIDREGQAKITDFGIAARSDRGPQLMGTPAYMAPERLAGREGTVQSDLYALGLVLYELATGTPTFHAQTPREYAELHQREIPVPLSRRVEDVDPRLEEAILRCLAKDPRDRPASALELAAALPGGDALGLALEVGDTPSPDLVADVRTPAAPIPPPRAAALLTALALGLAAVWLLADRTFREVEPQRIKPPQVLAERAQEILEELAHDTEDVLDRAWGFLPNEDEYRGDAAHLFWYRQSRDIPLVPRDTVRMRFDENRVDFEDPPTTAADECMVRMVLDSNGRLVMLYVIPPILEEDLAPPAGEESGYSAALRRAGFDPESLRPAEPRRIPAVYADHRAAWTGPDPRALPGPGAGAGPDVHVDAALHRGRVVYFSAWPEVVDEERVASFWERAWGLDMMTQSAFLGLVVAAVLLARGNLRRGRGDLKSARILAVAVVVVKSVSWALQGHHFVDLSTWSDALLSVDVELTSYYIVLGVALVEGLLAWVVYIALEPTVRRFWPQTLVSWSRLLRGRLRDPLVGTSLLVGAVAGTGWTAAKQIDRLAAKALGLVTGPDFDTIAQLEVALNGRMPLANLLLSGLYAVYAGVLLLFWLAVLRLLVRRPRWAAATFVLVYAGFVLLATGHFQVSWVLALVLAATSAWLLVRFGLLTYVAALTCHYVLMTSPITADLSAWFAGVGLFALLVPAFLGGFGCWTALAGRPLSSGWLDAEPSVTGRRRSGT